MMMELSFPIFTGSWILYLLISNIFLRSKDSLDRCLPSALNIISFENKMLVFIFLLCVYNTMSFWAMTASRIPGRSAYAMTERFSFVKLICMIKRLGMLFLLM